MVRHMKAGRGGEDAERTGKFRCRCRGQAKEFYVEGQGHQQAGGYAVNLIIDEERVCAGREERKRGR